MSRGFSLAGAAFAFHCLPPAERHELSVLVQSNNGTLYAAADTVKPNFVYVITSYWADCEPVASLSNVPLRLVTRFWLHETLRVGRWLRYDSHPFFEPPARPRDLWLQYPAQYQEAAGQSEVDADGDVNMQDPSPAGHRMRLPCSPSFLFRGEVPLWPYITAMLAQPMLDVPDLSARLQLVTLSDPRRSFNCLEYAMNELLTREERVAFFKDVLPEMVRLVLEMPQMFATPPPLLTPLETDKQVEGKAPRTANRTRVETQTHRFTKLEVLTLVCSCFFGISPDQDIVQCVQLDGSPQSKKAARRDSEDDVIQFPYFTAVRMFSAPGNMGRVVVLKAQKIRCLLQYFLRVVPRAISERPALSTEVIDFTRVGVHVPLAQGRLSAERTTQELLTILSTSESNTGATAQICPPHLHAARCVSDTLIEDLDSHLQVDFANKFAGGGVLNSGCVQEEIRFLLSPELLVSCLVFAKLEPHEAFVIHGTERYCAYQGYGGSFVYGGNFTDATPSVTLPDGTVRRQCVITGIDATDYGSARVERQYSRAHVWRDLVKAYAGFAYPDAQDDQRCWPVATGNWGCGVFQGDRELKFLIQWLAASLRQRELVYVLFDRDLDLQAKVKPLLALVASPKARDWDRQSGGMTQWLAGFLLSELSAGCATRGVQNVLTRASRSLEQALASLQLPLNRPQETESEANQQAQTSLVTLGSKQEPSATPRREADENSKKRSKTMHQMTMQDFFTPKQ
ncbi:Poly (ADP-ribose) glycohydrolase (PARG) [Phytophthora infestans]|uniref:poly(ADP-ribose) glycohydrolase n=1 Tax=Phytophthora infestans TaxID=4787 RepID=A0A833SGD0_PHYIN|nr:Poly (ADP-ribose) glycohydrolase (PARG) [Phytophthora infestans]